MDGVKSNKGKTIIVTNVHYVQAKVHEWKLCDFATLKEMFTDFT